MQRHLVIVEEEFAKRQPAVTGYDYMEASPKKRNA